MKTQVSDVRAGEMRFVSFVTFLSSMLWNHDYLLEHEFPRTFWEQAEQRPKVI